MTKIYHNPRCAKSRAALALLEARGIDFEVIKYLDTPPSEKELAGIVKMLGGDPQQLIRKGEKLFKELGLSEQTLSDSEWVRVLAEHPRLIERPIVIHNGQAAIGRPAENIEQLLNS